MIKNFTVQENGGFNGVVTFRNFLLTSPRAIEIDHILHGAKKINPDEYNELVNELAVLCPVRVLVRKNLVVMTGRTVFSRLLSGDTTYTGIINYGALGTSSTAVSDGQTQLVAEVKRKVVATVTRTNDQVNLDFYYSKADTNGTYQEFGTFIDGTASANTGQMYNRLLTGGWTKSASESMTVSLQINLNNA